MTEGQPQQNGVSRRDALIAGITSVSSFLGYTLVIHSNDRPAYQTLLKLEGSPEALTEDLIYAKAMDPETHQVLDPTNPKVKELEDDNAQIAQAREELSRSDNAILALYDTSTEIGILAATILGIGGFTTGLAALSYLVSPKEIKKAGSLTRSQGNAEQAMTHALRTSLPKNKTLQPSVISKVRPLQQKVGTKTVSLEDLVSTHNRIATLLQSPVTLNRDSSVKSDPLSEAATLIADLSDASNVFSKTSDAAASQILSKLATYRNLFKPGNSEFTPKPIELWETDKKAQIVGRRRFLGLLGR